MANYDDDDLDNLEEVEAEAEERGEARASNRNFLIAIGVIAAIFVLLTIALVVVATLFLPRQRAAREATNAVVLTQNVATALFATQEAERAAAQAIPTFTSTATITPVPATATNTAVVAVATNTNTATATVSATVEDARTATVAALLTQAAAGKTGTVVGTGVAGGTVGPGTATALPTSGFADEVGLPGLFGLALGLVVVIVLARRLRLSPNS